MPLSASQRTCPSSEWSETMKSRQAKVASTSTSAVAMASPGRLHRLTRPQQRLGGDARVIRAFTAHALSFDHGYPEAAFGQHSGTVLAWGAGTNHDHVEIAHLIPP